MIGEKHPTLPADGLVSNTPHPVLSGTQLIYRWGRYGLSVVDPPMLHSFPFAWEAAVVKFNDNVSLGFDLDYSTAVTNDVEVFETDAEASAFILKAKATLESMEKDKP